MTNAVTRLQPALTPSLPERGLRLLDERPAIRLAVDSFRGRHVERPSYPPLTVGERQALEQTQAALTANLAPGRRAVTIALLARLAAHRKTDRSPQEWQMLFEDFAEDLAEFSDAHVQEAITQHRRTCKFFPTPAELRAICLEMVARDRYRLRRCGVLLGGE